MSTPAPVSTRDAVPRAAAHTRVLPGEATVRSRIAAVAAVAEEHAERTDQSATFPQPALAAMRSSGLLGLLVPVDHGGLGGGLSELVDASIELGRVDLSVAMVFAMHCQQVAAIDRFGSAGLRAWLLPRVARGELYLGSVTTENGTGGHLLSSESPLRGRDDALELDRFAPVVTGGAHADGFLVTMRKPDAAGAHEVSLVYADRGQVEVSVAGGWDPLGMRASHSVPLKLRGVVPGDQVVGRHGAFREVVTQVFAPMAHLGWSACWLGTAAGALSRVLTFLRSKQGRAGYDLSSELLLAGLSQVRCRLDATHALVRHTTAVVRTADDLSIPRIQLLLNSLKITASEQSYAAVDQLVDLVGMRHGYLKGSPTWLERALRDLRSAPLNYSNDRLHLADGKLALLDPEVRLV
jgi:acyl-CoA dehydrogenase